MKTDRVSGVLLTAAGLAMALEASTFDVGFLTDPVGPKALPFLAGAIFVVAGLRLAARPGPEPAWPARTTLTKMALGVLAFLAYAAFMPSLGFFVSTTLVMTALSVLFGGGKRQSVLAAASLSGVLWYLFVWGLSLPLPLGSLWTR